MQALRVSATDLDQLRYFHDQDDMELAELIARLKHLMPSSEAMEAGTALHKAIELAGPGEHKGFTADGFTFSFETDAEIDLPAIREMKATREYLIDDVVVTVVGTARDPQGLDRQVEALANAGAEVHLSNAGATRRALEILGGSA